MIVVGGILIAIALGAILFARHHHARARAATETETLSCADLSTLAHGIESEVGGGFRQHRDQRRGGRGGHRRRPADYRSAGLSRARDPGMRTCRA
jgi:hypothetical protein